MINYIFINNFYNNNNNTINNTIRENIYKNQYKLKKHFINYINNNLKHQDDFKNIKCLNFYFENKYNLLLIIENNSDKTMEQLQLLFNILLQE